MKDTCKISMQDLDWLENKLKEIVNGDIAEKVSDLTIIEHLHWSCETVDDYYKVIDFLKKNPSATRNDVILLFMSIQETHPD